MTSKFRKLLFLFKFIQSQKKKNKATAPLFSYQSFMYVGMKLQDNL